MALARVPLGYFAGAPRVESSQPSDEEQAAELIRRIAADPKTAMSEEQLMQVTLAYRALRAQHKASRRDVESDGGQEPMRMRYDCNSMAVDSRFSGARVRDEYTFKRVGGETD